MPRWDNMSQEYYIDLFILYWLYSDYFVNYKSEHVTRYARKVHFLPNQSRMLKDREKVFGQKHDKPRPPGCLFRPNLSGRREGSVLRSFLSMFICDEPNTISTLMYFDIRDQDLEGNKLLTWRAGLHVIQTCNRLSSEVKCMVYHHITPMAAPESRQAPRSTWRASRCRGDHHLIGYRWLWWLYS